MCREVDTFVVTEIFQAFLVIFEESLHFHIHLIEIQARRHLEESRDADVEVRHSHITEAVGDEFRELLPESDFILKSDRDSSAMREDEVDEFHESSVFVNEMPHLVTYYETQLIVGHKLY